MGAFTLFKLTDLFDNKDETRKKLMLEYSGYFVIGGLIVSLTAVDPFCARCRVAL